jgi:hypothetical protein
MASPNPTPRADPDDSATFPADNEETGTDPPRHEHGRLDQDAGTGTETGGGSEGPALDPRSVPTAASFIGERAPPAEPLPSPEKPGPVGMGGSKPESERDQNSSLAASAQVRPGAVAVGGADAEIDDIVTESGSERRGNTKRDGRAAKRREGRSGRNRRGEDEPEVQSGAVATTKSFMNEEETPCKSAEGVEALEREESGGDIGKIASAKDEVNEEEIAAVTSTKPATVASIPPYTDSSFRYGEDSTSDPIAIPMVQAELVAPPVEAYHVSIDEEHATHAVGFNGSSPFELEQEPERMGRINTVWYNLKARRFSLRCSIFIALLTVAVTFAITIPLTTINSTDSTSGSFGAQSVTSPTSAPTFPYPCYTSTFDILRDQINEETIPDAFVICPGTLIQVGTFRDPAANDFTFVDGDYPIVAVRENVVIQCGLDGRRENNCTMDGGFMQVLTTQDIPVDPYEFGFVILDTPVDNFTVRGVTFTGQPINAGPFEGLSVMLCHPAKNIRFEDCLWRDISAQNGLIGVYQNAFQDVVNRTLQDGSIDVTLSGCAFENIVYDAPLIYTVEQSVALERTVFEGVSLSFLVAGECRFGTKDVSVLYDDGCAGLLYCGPGSVCSMNDVCVFEFEYNGPSIVNVAENAVFTSNSLFLSSTAEDIVNVEHNFGGLQPGTESPSDTCELTFVSLANSTVSNCTDIFTAPTCPLDLR